MPIFYVFIKRALQSFLFALFCHLTVIRIRLKQCTNTSITNDIGIHRIRHYTSSYKDKSKSVIEIKNRFSVNKSSSLSLALSQGQLLVSFPPLLPIPNHIFINNERREV